MLSTRFVESLRILVDGGRIDPALDLIFRWTDERMREGRFDEVGLMLAIIDVSRFDEDILVGLLCSTSCCKAKIAERADFAERCLAHLTLLIGRDEAEQLIGDIS